MVNPWGADKSGVGVSVDDDVFLMVGVRICESEIVESDRVWRVGEVDVHACSCLGLSSICLASVLVVGSFAGAAESVFASFRVFRQLAYRNDFHVCDGCGDKLRYALSRRDFDGSFTGVVQDHA